MDNIRSSKEIRSTMKRLVMTTVKSEPDRILDFLERQGPHLDPSLSSARKRRDAFFYMVINENWLGYTARAQTHSLRRWIERDLSN